MAVITLTTDFGWRDGYVGAMKGVIARLAPDATVVDIAHDVPRGDVAHGAWVVWSATREFPDDTIHVVVVDPGVGTSRRAVAVRAHQRWYIGPDNGVFAYVADAPQEAWSIAIPPDASKTFHGRDVFAPAAAALARGHSIASAGEAGARAEAVELAGALPWGPRPDKQGRVVHVDHFGNLVSDLPANEAEATIAIAGHTLPIVPTYEAVAPGQLLAYVGSMGTVEVAVREGSAAQLLNARRGQPVLPGSASPFR